MRYAPGTIIGYLKSGKPIRVQAGGSMPPGEPIPQPQTAPQPQPIIINTPQPGQQYFTAEQLEAARKQEKDKLYERMQKLETQFESSKTELEQFRTAREKAEADKVAAEKAAADATKKAEEEKLSVTDLIAKRDAEWLAEKESLKQQMETERVIAERDRELFRLQSYIQRRVAEEVAQDNIAPEFLDYIDGSNEAEVEASITKAKEKTATIVAGIGGQTPRLSPGVSPAGFAPSGPLDNIAGQRTYTQEQIKAMSTKEYAQFRAQIGVDKAGNNQGLFS